MSQDHKKPRREFLTGVATTAAGLLVAPRALASWLDDGVDEPSEMSSPTFLRWAGGSDGRDYSILAPTYVVGSTAGFRMYPGQRAVLGLETDALDQACTCQGTYLPDIMMHLVCSNPCPAVHVAFEPGLILELSLEHSGQVVNGRATYTFLCDPDVQPGDVLTIAATIKPTPHVGDRLLAVAFIRVVEPPG